MSSTKDTAGTKILLSNDPNCHCEEIYGVKRKKFLRQSQGAQAVDLHPEIASENHFTSLHDFHRNDSRLVFLLCRLFFIGAPKFPLPMNLMLHSPNKVRSTNKDRVIPSPDFWARPNKKSNHDNMCG